MTDNEAYFLEQIELIKEQHKLIRSDLDFIKEHIVKADETIQMVSKEVMPTIDSLMKSPLIKMLGMKTTSRGGEK